MSATLKFVVPYTFSFESTTPFFSLGNIEQLPIASISNT